MFVLTFNKKQLGLSILSIVISCALLIGSLQFNILSIQAKGEDTSGVDVPIIMYHSVLKDSKRAGKYIVSPDTIEQDMLYLKNLGYTTIVMSDLIDYVYQNKPLPEKPIVLTIDDGYYNNLTYVYPLLQKHAMKAVISVVGEYTERFTQTNDPNPNYAHLNWNDLRTLSESGYIEIQSHSYNLHNQNKRKGCQKLRGESVEQYTTMLKEDLSKMQNCLKDKSGIIANTFTYPYGQISKDSLAIIKNLGFKASLSCYEKPNLITKDPECLYQLNRYNRASGASTEAFMKKIGVK